jgi:hypothetical protein
MVIVGFSLTDDGLTAFLKAIRYKGSASRGSGVVLLAPKSQMERAARHVGRGANRVLDERTLSSRLQQTVGELHCVAPRLPVTSNARIKIHVKGKPIQSFCQTRNLSATGVLIRGFAHYPLGANLDFQINIPGDDAPIQGSGTISRRTRRLSEQIDGLGIRFTSFHGTDQKRLASFLAASGRRPGFPPPRRHG